MDFVGHQMTLRVIKDHVPASHHLAGSHIKGSLIGMHVHVLVNDFNATAQMVGIFILLLRVRVDDDVLPGALEFGHRGRLLRTNI